MERIIFHVDVNSAFLSWSAVKRLEENPGSVDLRTIPSAVGGNVKTRHGIITAKSIPAKRFGVTTGEPVVKALQKCPGLVLVSSDWETYHHYSQAFIAILREYSDLVEQASVDEAYVDMTETVMAAAAGLSRRSEKLCGENVPKTAIDYAEEQRLLLREKAEALASDIRDKVRTRLGFTVNVGISSNKLLAKMASDFKKPDRTHTLWPEEVADKMWPLPIGSLYGCGSRTAARLSDIGIMTIGDAARADLPMLQSFLGEKGGAYIQRAARGIGSTQVQVQSEDAKSYSNEVTTSEDITTQNYERLALPLIRKLSEKVAGRLARDGVYGSTVTVSVKTSDFRRRSRQKKLASSTRSEEIIRKNAEGLLRGLLYEENGIFDHGGGVRLIGVGVSSLDRGEYRQMDLESFLCEQKKDQKRKAQEQKKHQLDEMMKQLQHRYGEAAVYKGTSGM